VATTIIGPETMSEMDQNLGALEIELTPDQMEVLNEIGINVPLPGNRR
jgi:aryl-alcohol dehydrogenase-like predicted oxidoreductase